jgi:hypothetical protein
MRCAKAGPAGHTRLESSGILFLRSICRLTHVGHACYVKGDGDDFAAYLEENFPGLKNNCVDRAEHSKVDPQQHLLPSPLVYFHRLLLACPPPHPSPSSTRTKEARLVL